VSSSTLKPAIFLDRDGVIVENRADYVKSIDEVHILPGALEGLAQAARLDCRIVVVTNQSVVGRGLLTEPALLAIHAAIHATIVAAGGRIDAWYFCPHPPEAGCACRKPKPGMLLSAAADWHIDLPASVMVGDALSDVQAGHAASAQAILVATGLGHRHTAELAPVGPTNVPVVSDLAAALQHIAASPNFTKTPPDGGAGKTLTPGILPHNPPLNSASP
jgi:D-glycero-D-manno-heptose 1,7-bisphosphate phosphatase